MRDLACPSVIISLSNSVVGSGCGFAVGRQLQAIWRGHKTVPGAVETGSPFWFGWQITFSSVDQGSSFNLLNATGGPLTIHTMSMHRYVCMIYTCDTYGISKCKTVKHNLSALWQFGFPMKSLRIIEERK